MSQARPTFWNRKIKDAKPLALLNTDVWKNAFQRWVHNYNVKYIRPGKFTPIVHLIGVAAATGYAFEWASKGGTYSAISCCLFLFFINGFLFILFPWSLV